MCFFHKDDFGYDRTFDYNCDGKLDFFERSEQLDFYTGSGVKDYDAEAEEEEVEYTMALNGLDIDDLEYMDEDERLEALEDAGLDPDDFDF